MVASDSPGLVNFAIRVVDPVLNLPDSPRASSRGALWRRGKQISFPSSLPHPRTPGRPRRACSQATCPTGKWTLREFKLQKNCNQSCSSKTFLWLIKMNLGLVHASCSLLKWQAVKMIFFTPWSKIILLLIRNVKFYCGWVTGLIWVTYLTLSSDWCPHLLSS